ncbi:RNA-directed DNA polymerase, eukaryota, reverse transcriptase zinc-binding domain protein [Tanacetum coccineum]
MVKWIMTCISTPHFTICVNKDNDLSWKYLIYWKEVLRSYFSGSKIGVNDCKCLIDKVKKKLSDWKNKSLSYAGRSQLIASDGNQALSQVISKRDIYSAGFKDNVNLCDLVDANGWKWHAQWNRKYSLIQSLNVPKLVNKPDSLVWITNSGNEVRFTTNQAWRDIRNDESTITWEKLVWFSIYKPRHTFVLCLVVKNKLLTQDKLVKWYSHKIMKCSFYKVDIDSHDHLFFQCGFAKEIWIAIKDKAKIRTNANKWDDIVKELSYIKNHNSM